MAKSGEKKVDSPHKLKDEIKSYKPTYRISSKVKPSV